MTATAFSGSRLLRFLTVGVGAAGLFFLLTFLLVSAGLPPFIGSMLAYAISFVVAYLAQRGWTFGGRHDHSHSLPRYFALQLTCATVTGGVSHVAVNEFGMSPLAMSALATVLASAVSYVVSSLWVFPDREGPR
jgi:putative flippase GtrA